MRRNLKTALTWSLMALAACLVGSVPAQAQTEQTPPDETISTAEPDPSVKAVGAEKDDATARLEWERQAWGPANPAFRFNSMRRGREHGGRKHLFGARWVNIGPNDAEFEQNGSFTGFETDSGRARTILPHPTNPNIVYFLTSGGGLWKTNNWQDDDTEWRPLTDDLPTTGGGAVAFDDECGIRGRRAVCMAARHVAPCGLGEIAGAFRAGGHQRHLDAGRSRGRGRN